jgi:hypothetical protein
MRMCENHPVFQRYDKESRFDKQKRWCHQSSSEQYICQKSTAFLFNSELIKSSQSSNSTISGQSDHLCLLRFKNSKYKFQSR